MGELVAQVRSVLPIFLVAALVLVFGVFVARRAGFFADTVTVTGSSASFTDSGEGFRRAEGPEPGALDDRDDRTGAVSRDLRIVTLLPKDGIPAIFDPGFVTAEVASEWLRSDDQVIGVSINGEHRAYGTAFLSNREVVNDTVGGRPIMVTW
jgi:hypothetical protein